MKVEVITLHYVKNYGSVLQTYATQKFLQKFGCEVEFVDYVRENERIDISLKKKFIKCLKGIYLFCRKRVSIYREDFVFRNFISKYINLSEYYGSYVDLKSNYPKADIYCTGGDQMWNSVWNGCLERAYFLDFLDDEQKRFSYSTSIGMLEFPEDQVDAISQMLSKYDFISVRETTAVEVLKKIGIKDAVHLLDPTFMLTSYEWKELDSINKPYSVPYLLVYQLNPNEKMSDFAREKAKQLGLKLVRVAFSIKECFEDRETVYFPTVEQWVSLFINADYIVTDSFHGTAFAINLNRPFNVFYPPRFKTRIDSILELVDLKSRLIVESDDAGCGEANGLINWDNANSILDKKREETDAFIRRVLLTVQE